MLTDWSLFSGVASALAGIELKNNIVIVLGNSETASGDCVIAHAVMQDAIDAAAVTAAMGGAADVSRIVNVLAKADPSPNGLVRGWRHTMLDDTDISATLHARAAVGGLIAGVTGCPAIYVSGRADIRARRLRGLVCGDFAAETFRPRLSSLDQPRGAGVRRRPTVRERSLPSTPQQFDAIVIGAGQSGPFLAVKLAEAGWKTAALIEREHLGGTCVNDGCMPTKTLVACAPGSHRWRGAPAHYGVSTSGPADDRI